MQIICWGEKFECWDIGLKLQSFSEFRFMQANGLSNVAESPIVFIPSKL